MININIIKWYQVLAVCCILFTHCTPYDDFKKYMPNGEIIYLQKADSVKTYPGKNRIQLEWVITDPKVTYSKVLYEQQGIVQETIVPKNNESDTICLIISNLEETTCWFKIISYDDFGHTSIPVEVDELAYGDMYEQTLLNRVLKSFTVDEINNKLLLEWYEPADDTEIGIELVYTDINNVTQIMFFERSETSVILPDFKLGEPLYISTKYKPVPFAIDVFSTEPKKVDLTKIVNVALKKPVEHSGCANNDSQYAGGKAVDGITSSNNSRWISDMTHFNEHWVEINLQDYYSIFALKLFRQSNAQSMPMWRFQAWINNDWVTVVSHDNNSTLIYYEEFEPVTTNKVRWYIPPYQNNTVRLFEIEVYSNISY